MAVALYRRHKAAAKFENRISCVHDVAIVRMLRPSGLVIKVLQANGIEVASIHNHLLDNEPQLVFMHFWAYGDAIGFAKGLRAAKFGGK